MKFLYKYLPIYTCCCRSLGCIITHLAPPTLRYTAFHHSLLPLTSAFHILRLLLPSTQQNSQSTRLSFPSYEVSGYKLSLRFMPSSSRIGCSSFTYSSYCPSFSTFALMPTIHVLVCPASAKDSEVMRSGKSVMSYLQTPVPQ